VPHGRLTPWLEACRAAAADIRQGLVDLPGPGDRGPGGAGRGGGGGPQGGAAREPVIAAGEGGDDTTAIDAAAEQAVVARLEALHEQGHDFTLVSEELGIKAFGDSDLHGVVRSEERR